MADEVLEERRGAVQVLTLNRPAKRNAMNGAMARALAAAVDRAEADEHVRVCVLAGSGGSFCAGMDLAAFVDGDVPEVPGRGLGGITTTPPQLPMIAAVEGYAVAGGLELVLACDLLVASSEARFGLPEVTRGLVAGAGGLVRLPARIPSAVALEYAMTGGTFDAASAERWGLVNRLCEPGDALTTAVELAERIAANAPLAVRLTKQIVHAAPHWGVDETHARQQALLAQVMSSADAHEGASAFAEKRAPRWTGQ